MAIGDTFGNALNLLKSMISKPTIPSQTITPVVVETYEKEIEAAKSLLLKAANREIDASQSDNIVNSLMDLEKLMRKQNKADGGKTADLTLDNINGCWRLIFTTGTVSTQKKTGRINFFPLKAVQTFDTTQSPMRITNGIFLGDFAAIKFFGPFEFNKNLRKLVFDFDQIAVFGIKFNLPKGGAAKIGSSTGLGSENNVDLAEQGKNPFFNWISADSEIATARGGGGGLALWKRDREMEAASLAEASTV